MLFCFHFLKIAIFASCHSACLVLFLAHLFFYLPVLWRLCRCTVHICCRVISVTRETAAVASRLLMSLKRAAAQEVEKSNAIDMCFCQGALKKVHRTEDVQLPLLQQPQPLSWWGVQNASIGEQQQQQQNFAERTEQHLAGPIGSLQAWAANKQGTPVLELSLQQWGDYDARHTGLCMSDDEETQDTACSSFSGSGGGEAGLAVHSKAGARCSKLAGEDDSVTSSQPNAAYSAAFSFCGLPNIPADGLMAAWPATTVAAVQ